MWCGLCLVAAVAVAWFFLRPPKTRVAPTRKPVDPARKFVRGSGEEIRCVAPSTGELLSVIRAYTADEVKAACNRARVAQKDWAKTSWDERRAVLQDILDWMVQNQEQIIRWSVDDSGKTVTEAQLGEVMATCEKVRWVMMNGERYLSPESRCVPLLLRFTKRAFVEWFPFGVIGIIVPWNYPFQNIISHVVTALMCGNGALVKVSEYSSHSADAIESLLRTILARRGHNPDLVQVVCGMRFVLR